MMVSQLCGGLRSASGSACKHGFSRRFPDPLFDRDIGGGEHFPFHSISREAVHEYYRVGWTLDRSLIVAAGAATVLCWPASVPKFDPTWMYDNDVYYRTPELLGACFTAAVLLVILVAGRRPLVASAKAKWRLGGEVLASLSMVLLLGPFLYSALSREVVLWFMRFVPQGVLISLYAGLLGAAWLVFSTCRVRYSRNAVLLPFGMGVQLQRNPQDGRHG